MERTAVARGDPQTTGGLVVKALLFLWFAERREWPSIPEAYEVLNGEAVYEAWLARMEVLTCILKRYQRPTPNRPPSIPAPGPPLPAL